MTKTSGKGHEFSKQKKLPWSPLISAPRWGGGAPPPPPSSYVLDYHIKAFFVTESR